MDDIEKEARRAKSEAQVKALIDHLVAQAIEQKTPAPEVAFIDKVMRPFVLYIEIGNQLTDYSEMLEVLVSGMGNMVAHIVAKYARKDDMDAAVHLANAVLHQMALAADSALQYQMSHPEKKGAKFMGPNQGGAVN